MYYNKSIDETLSELNSSEKGLSDKEANERIKKYGLNKLEEDHKLKPLLIFLRQFKESVIYILLLAVIISILLKEYLDATVIAIILIINAVFGFYQEYKAERSMELLKKLSSPKANVRRNGIIKEIDSKFLAPGDIIILEEGDKISADARIINCTNLKTDESSLTGESITISKTERIIDHEVEIGDQKNMVFSGTIVTNGKCEAIVISTAMNTEIGKVAKLVKSVGTTKTPLQKKLSVLGRQLSYLVLAICTVIFIVGALRNIPPLNIFLTAISLAVAAIPEGLPAVVTICLAIGVKKMLSKNVLIRRLQSVETLGSTTLICSDKTGTLTKNEMTVTEIFTNNRVINVAGEGYDTKGDFYYKNRKTDPKLFYLLLISAASCNNSQLPKIGDPTELALLVAAKKAGFDNIGNRISEIPFNSKKKFMLTKHKIKGKEISFMKGAPEVIIEKCSYVMTNGLIRRLTPDEKKLILDQNTDMASRALRVLAIACVKDDKPTFLGLMGMIDPPREEVREAIHECINAGIKIVMLTGDHKETAKAVGAKIGINGTVMEGIEIEKLEEDKLKEIAKDVAIFARVTPEHKLKILTALQNNNEIVAMTGDGVNDAPALKKADIGIAMSIKGTDVARESSDMVLLDDNFASIVNAVKEGRVIYGNIKKFCKFLLGANIGEVLVILVTILAGLPLPLLPLQILWVNLTTDGFPALALSVEPQEHDVMKKKPRKKGENILKGSLPFLTTAGILCTISVIMIFIYALSLPGSIDKARTMATTTLILYELFLVFSCRSDKNLFEFNLFSNRYLLLSVALSVLLHTILIYTPLNTIFHFTYLNITEWLTVLLAASTGFIFLEVKKLIIKENEV